MKKLQMTTRRRFGFSNQAQLNTALVDALRDSMQACENCAAIEKDVEPNAEGGTYVEAPSFPGASVQKLDAHFKFHWKQDYELVDISNAGTPR